MYTNGTNRSRSRAIRWRNMNSMSPSDDSFYTRTMNVSDMNYGARAHASSYINTLNDCDDSSDTSRMKKNVIRETPVASSRSSSISTTVRYKPYKPDTQINKYSPMNSTDHYNVDHQAMVHHNSDERDDMSGIDRHYGYQIGTIISSDNKEQMMTPKLHTQHISESRENVAIAGGYHADNDSTNLDRVNSYDKYNNGILLRKKSGAYDTFSDPSSTAARYVLDTNLKVSSREIRSPTSYGPVTSYDSDDYEKMAIANKNKNEKVVKIMIPNNRQEVESPRTTSSYESSQLSSGQASGTDESSANESSFTDGENDDNTYATTTSTTTTSQTKGGSRRKKYDDDSSYVTSVSTIISETMKRVSKSKKRNVSGKESVLRKKHSVACRYLRDGKYAKSLRCFEEILVGIVDRFGKDHERVGTAMHNLGIVHLRAGDLKKALSTMEVAVELRSEQLGKLHSKVADSLVELGIIFLSMREFENSLETFNEALELREAVLEGDPDHPKQNLLVAKVLNNIGCVYFEYGEIEHAKLAFNEALRKQQRFLGNDDPTVEPGVLSMASTMCNIAYVLLEEKRYASAIDMLEQALQIQEAVLEADNKFVLNTLENLSYSYLKYGNFDEALKNYYEILDTQRQVHGPKSSCCIKTLKKITYIKVKGGEYEEALEILMEVNQLEQLRNISKKVPSSPTNQQVTGTLKLINEINYQLLKFPNVWDMCVTGMQTKGFFRNPFTQRSLDVTFLHSSDSKIDLSSFEIKQPMNSSKLAGHKVTYN